MHTVSGIGFETPNHPDVMRLATLVHGLCSHNEAFQGIHCDPIPQMHWKAGADISDLPKLLDSIRFEAPNEITIFYANDRDLGCLEFTLPTFMKAIAKKEII